MGRPLGSRNKSKEDVEIADVKEAKEVFHEEEREKTAQTVQVKPKLEPLGPGQKYFEAPDGTILIGEADMPHLWYRAGNGGKGEWINPRR